MQNLQLKVFISGKFKGNIGILSTLTETYSCLSEFCQKIATFYPTNFFSPRRCASTYFGGGIRCSGSSCSHNNGTLCICEV